MGGTEPVSCRMRGWRHATFAFFSRAARALDLAARALMYLAAGALDRRALRETITRNWDEFSRTEAAILSGLMAWEQAWYERMLKPADQILLVGCGTGRDLIALIKQGFRVTGLDPSARALDLARGALERERLSAALYTGSIEHFAPPGGFDVVIFSWFCYGYIPETTARVNALHNVKARLKPGGRILVSYIPADPAPRPLAIKLTRLTARLTRSDWQPAVGDVIGPMTADPGSIRYEHQFTDGELEKEARVAGLTIVVHERSDVGKAVLMMERGGDVAAGDDPDRAAGAQTVTDR